MVKLRADGSLVGDKPGQIRGHLLGELSSPISGTFKRLRRQNLRDDANQGAIGPVHSDSVGDHIELCFVLIGDAAAMRLIPIDNKLFDISIADDVFAHPVFLAVDVLKAGVCL